MLFITVHNEHHKLNFYELDFTNDLLAGTLPTQTLPGRFHQKIAS